jgi:hypothetical protein
LIDNRVGSEEPVLAAELHSMLSEVPAPIAAPKSQRAERTCPVPAQLLVRCVRVLRQRAGATGMLVAEEMLQYIQPA